MHLPMDPNMPNMPDTAHGARYGRRALFEALGRPGAGAWDCLSASEPVSTSSDHVD